MLKNHRLWAGFTSILVLLLALMIFLGNLAFVRAGDVNLYLGILPPTAEVTDNTNYFPSDYKNKDEMRAALKEYLIDSQIQGSVLLKNEGGALPFAAGSGVTLFGSGSVTPVYHGGSGGPGFYNPTTLFDALKAEGISVNDIVFNKLKGEKTDYFKTGKIGEVDVSAYESVKSSFSSYNDAAIFVMRRFGGEEGELNHGLDGIWEEGPVGVPELSLHDEEKAVLNLIKSSGFKKIIVLINSGYAVELDWLEEYGVDACLWIGYPGEFGMAGVAKVLAGKADPSGRLVDTYAANSLSSPAIQNAGDFTFTNLSGLYKNKYVVYAEGIYLGYKYYETRYNDSVLGVNNAKSAAGKFASKGAEWNYADEMTYTFGSGQSYAQFTQELVSVDWDREAHKVTAKVKVTNNGDEVYEGKSRDVVQMYVQLPWENGQAEKSAIQLVDFEKTIELASGADTVVTLEFSDYVFATYDENATNGADTTKKGCYVFDDGEYHFAIGDNAHDALNNVLAKRDVTGLYDENGNSVTGDKEKVVSVTLDELDNKTWAKSQYTSNVVSNLFEDRDLNYFIPDSVTYLTRADWNTFPKPVKNITATDKIKDLMENSQYEKPADAPDISEFKYGQKNNIKFVEMRTVDYDEDEKWEKFIDQLTVAELCQIVGDQMKMDTIKSVDMPAFGGGDGPDGHQSGVLFNAEMVASSSFSKEVLKNRGKFFAEESYYIGFRQIYGPGANLHRTPYSGRNFEYYSEDPTHSSICGEIQAGESAKRGLVTHIKHFCGNDQETNRHGVAQFMTEQAYRQGPLKGFEGALSGDTSLGLMSAYNRIGCIPTAADYETMQLVLRDEWGFRGINMTDSSKDSVSYMSTEDCMHAGTNQFNNDPDRVSSVSKFLVKQKDGYIWQRLRLTAKNFFYAMSHSMLSNGLSKDTVVEDFVPWWQTAIISACTVLGVITLAAAGMFVYTAYFAEKPSAKKSTATVEENDKEEE